MYDELLRETDRLDSAQLEPDDVTDPKGWILVGYTLDPRTGMARYRDYFGARPRTGEELSGRSG